jgi:hypothetical protein
MTDQKESKKMKYCSKCQIVKELEGGFYKAGKSWQKLCKICHNESRIEYATNKVYIPKATGFLKLPEDLRNKIIYDIYIRINFKDIYNKYKDDYPKIKHQTLLKWNRENQIPNYVEV